MILEGLSLYILSSNKGNGVKIGDVGIWGFGDAKCRY